MAPLRLLSGFVDYDVRNTGLESVSRSLVLLEKLLIAQIAKKSPIFFFFFNFLFLFPANVPGQK
jgi:hypothetical protein